MPHLQRALRLIDPRERAPAAATGVALLLIAGCTLLPQSGARGIEQNLLPPVLVAGEPAWTLVERMAHHKVPGVSIAVIEDFEVVWEEGYGLADGETSQQVTERTLFQAASISKAVAAVGFMRLVDQQRVALEAEANSVLRSWKLPANKFTRKQPVTFAQLLSHSAGTTVHGFPGYAADDAVPTLVQVLDGAKPANTAAVRVDQLPGEGFRYSGGGTTVVQQALQDLSGQPFAPFMREILLAPLGIPRSTYQQPLPAERLAGASAGHLDNGRPIPGKRHTYPEQAAAGLWTTAGDLARFAVAIQRAARGDAGAVLSPTSVQRMLTPLAPPMGVGFFVDSPKPGYFGHGGANEGFRCYLIAHKEKGYGAVVMTNGEGGGALIMEILRGIAQARGWEGLLPDVVQPAALGDGQLAAFAGRWRIGADSVIALAPHGGRLAGTAALEPAFELIPVSADTFVRTDRQTRYRFDGERLVLEDNGKETAVARRAGALAPSELLAAGDVAAARTAYRRALKAAPKDPSLARSRLNELGNAVLLRGDAAAAVALQEIVAGLYPDSSLAQYFLAEAQIENGQSKVAAATLRKALKLAGSDPEVAAFREAARHAARKRLQRLEAADHS